MSHNQLPVNWDRERLNRVPATFPAPGFAAEGVRALFYEGVPYRGRPTRVFAWLGLPESRSGARCPAMVLLHGGGGTAFDEWVRLWTRRGYAALAMDLTGCLPGPHPKEGQPHARHEQGGPPGWGASFEQTADPVEDQWSYHAVAAAVAGHSLLAAQPEVAPDQIGVTGLSWGGYLTCLVTGADTRFCGAAPVYGCGFLGEDSIWRDNYFPSRPPAEVRRWLELWDPSRYLPHATMPLCWVTSTNDLAYPLSSVQKSYRLPPGPRTLCVRVGMPHSHVDGWKPAEIGVFMDSLTGRAAPLPWIKGLGREGRMVRAVCEPARLVTRAELCFTRALGHWTDRQWNTAPARWDSATGRIEAELPAQTTVWFLNAFDDRDCVVSTPHAEVTD